MSSKCDVCGKIFKRSLSEENQEIHRNSKTHQRALKRAKQLNARNNMWSAFLASPSPSPIAAAPISAAPIAVAPIAASPISSQPISADQQLSQSNEEPQTISLSCGIWCIVCHYCAYKELWMISLTSKDTLDAVKKWRRWNVYDWEVRVTTYNVEREDISNISNAIEKFEIEGVKEHEEPATLSELIEPATLSELKLLIINRFDDCISFFHGAVGTLRYKCDYCMKHIDIAKRYSSRGLRGSLTDKGAFARKKYIWLHLIGIHQSVKNYNEVSNKYIDEWNELSFVLDEPMRSFVVAYGWKEGMINYIIDNDDGAFTVNLYVQKVRCVVCNIGYGLDDDKQHHTVWVDGRSIDGVLHKQFERHKSSGSHQHYETMVKDSTRDVNENENDLSNLIESEVAQYGTNLPLKNRFKIILWMLKEKIPPNRFKSAMRLLFSLNCPDLGVSGTSSSVVTKMTNVCGVYINAVIIQYIKSNVKSMTLGLDCVKTRDDIKMCHFHLRIVAAAFPVTLHFGSRKILGTCDGAKLLQTLKKLVTWSDLDDVEYVGISVGKVYYELDDTKDIQQLVNVIKLMRDSGIEIGFQWHHFIQKLFHYVSDGGGDVFGKNIGLAGRLSRIKKDECGVELTVTHGVCHVIDILAKKGFLICALFAEIIDWITTYRTFINASEFRKSKWIYHCQQLCCKFLVLAREFETRWIQATYGALKAWKNNYNGTMFLLEQCKEEILNKCRKDDNRERITAKIEDLTKDICNLRSHMMAYGSENLMKSIVTKWEALSESEDLNVITYIDTIEELERIIRIKKTNIDRTEKMFPWMIQFHDENVINVGSSPRDRKYRWNKYDVVEDGDEFYIFESFKPNQYAKHRNAVQTMYIECCDEILELLKQHKKHKQFEHWYLFKHIADYKIWNLNTIDVDEAKEWNELSDKTYIHQLFEAKYETFMKMGMEKMSKNLFVSKIVLAQSYCLEAINTFREEGQLLIDVIKRKDIDFYDIWSIVYHRLEDTHCFIVVYEYFISINPGNPFAERQGRIMNLVRNILAQRTLTMLLDSKLRGHFNLPADILKHENHLNNLTFIWKEIIRGHDVIKESGIIQLQLEEKLPNIKAKSYHCVKRNLKKQSIKSQIWNKAKISMKRLKRRKFKNRGK